MIIVADTSTVHYLVLIQAEEVLPKLFQRVLISAEVHTELCDSDAPLLVKEWIFALPPWGLQAPLPMQACRRWTEERQRGPTSPRACAPRRSY